MTISDEFFFNKLVDHLLETSVHLSHYVMDNVNSTNMFYYYFVIGTTHE